MFSPWLHTPFSGTRLSQGDQLGQGKSGGHLVEVAVDSLRNDNRGPYHRRRCCRPVLFSCWSGARSGCGLAWSTARSGAHSGRGLVWFTAHSGAHSGCGLAWSTALGTVVPDSEIASSAVSPRASCLLRGREQGTALPAWPPQHNPPPGPPVLSLLGAPFSWGDLVPTRGLHGLQEVSSYFLSWNWVAGSSQMQEERLRSAFLIRNC